MLSGKGVGMCLCVHVRTHMCEVGKKIWLLAYGSGEYFTSGIKWRGGRRSKGRVHTWELQKFNSPAPPGFVSKYSMLEQDTDTLTDPDEKVRTDHYYLCWCCVNVCERNLTHIVKHFG